MGPAFYFAQRERGRERERVPGDDDGAGMGPRFAEPLL